MTVLLWSMYAILRCLSPAPLTDWSNRSSKYDALRRTDNQKTWLMCQQIAEMGAYVKLLEYDNIDGMILLSELSRRRIRSIQKLIRVGRNEVVVVLRVDKEKGLQNQRDNLCY